MKINPELQLRSIAGENVVIMPNDGATDLTSILSLNETSKWLWEELQGKEFDAAMVASLILEAYEGVDEATAKSDAAAWVNQLGQVGALIK